MKQAPENRLSLLVRARSKHFLYVLGTVTLIFLIRVTARNGLPFAEVGLFGTKHSYLAWLETTSKLSFPDFRGAYIASFNHLVAPEPVPAVVGMLISSFSLDPILGLDFLSFLMVVVYLSLVLRSKCPFSPKLIIIFGLCFGFYEYILIFDTYRLLVAFLFLCIGLNLNRSPRLQVFSLLLAAGSHYSVALLYPLFYLAYKYYEIEGSPFSLKRLFKITFLLIFINGILVTVMAEDILERIVQKGLYFLNDLGDPFPWTPLVLVAPLVVILAVVISFLTTMRQFRRPLVMVFSVAYVFLIIFIYGTDRIAMLLYFFFIFTYLLLFSRLQTLEKKFATSILLVFGAWSLYRAYDLGVIKFII